MNYEPYSETYQANRLYQYIKKLDSLQIQEAYFFKLVEGTSNPAHSTSGLISDTTLTEKSAYYLFQSFIECFTSIYEYDSGKEIRVYPNPTSEFLTIESQQQLNNEEIQIYNSLGILVLVVRIKQNTTEIDVSKLVSGLYIVRLKNHPQQTLKFIKQ